MQRIYTILSIILCACSLFARTPQEAAQIASDFIYQRRLSATPMLRIQHANQSAGIDSHVELAHTQYQVDNTTPAFYVFNDQQLEGFVLISAIDNARTILGYADHGNFNTDDIPCNMQLWLQMYAEELAYAATFPQRAAANPSLNTQYPEIAPLLGETQWGQGKPFNNMCPMVDGERSVAGCVATALSQIMYKHQYPTHGIGSHSYRLRNGTQLSVDFSQATYDWENMIPRYNKSYTQEQADAVAELMYHVGVSCNMGYSPSASGAVSQIALQAIHTYFGYDAGLTPLLKDYMSEDKILTAIAADLQQGLPIYMSGTTINYEGHAFVCDGMQSNGYLHINWGWNGTGDGYYSLSALDPGQHGTGGSAQNLAFTVDVCAYTNLRPDQGGTPKPLISADGQVRTSKAKDRRDEYIQFEHSIFASQGLANANGYIGFFVYDTNQQLVSQITPHKINLKPGYYYTHFPISEQLPASLAAGEYELAIGLINEAEEIYPILVAGKGATRYPFTLTADSIFFHEETTPQLPDTLQADFSHIAGTNSWEMDLYSPAFWQNTRSNEILIRCQLNANSDNSVIGSYILDKKNAATSSSIHLSKVVCAFGNGKECQQYTPTELQLTLLQEPNGKLGVHYIMTVNFFRYVGYAVIDSCTWSQLSDGNYLPYAEEVTYQPATALSASEAINLAKERNNINSMLYLVKGTISNMLSTPDEIITQQYANCMISDNGDKENSLLCNQLQWMNHQDYTTGEELQNGDEIVILAQIPSEEKNIEVIGTLYEHHRPEGTPIHNCQLTTDGLKMNVSWESEAAYFKIRLYNKNDKKIAENIINRTTLTATVPEAGRYTFWVRPMNDDKKTYAGPALEIPFTASISSGTELFSTATGAILYDLQGNIVDKCDECNINQLQVPYKGIYILKTDTTRLIYR